MMLKAFKLAAIGGIVSASLLLSGNAARADAYAYADLDLSGSVTGLSLSDIQGGLSGITGTDTVSADAFFGTNYGGNYVQTLFDGNSGTRIVPSGAPLSESALAGYNPSNNFSASNASLNGNLLTGVTSDTNATTAALNNYGGATNTSSTSTATDFAFTATATTSFTLTLNGTFTLQALNTSFGGVSAFAKVDILITLINTTPDATQDDQTLSFLKQVSFSGGKPSATQYLTASVGTLSKTFDIIQGDSYELQITQDAETNAFAVPEPGTLALLGFGLFGAGALGLRRRKAS